MFGGYLIGEDPVNFITKWTLVKFVYMYNTQIKYITVSNKYETEMRKKGMAMFNWIVFYSTEIILLLINWYK